MLLIVCRPHRMASSSPDGTKLNPGFRALLPGLRSAPSRLRWFIHQRIRAYLLRPLSSGNHSMQYLAESLYNYSTY